MQGADVWLPACRTVQSRHSDVDNAAHLRSLGVREEVWQDPAVGTGSQ